MSVEITLEVANHSWKFKTKKKKKTPWMWKFSLPRVHQKTFMEISTTRKLERNLRDLKRQWNVQIEFILNEWFYFSETTSIWPFYHWSEKKNVALSFDIAGYFFSVHVVDYIKFRAKSPRRSLWLSCIASEMLLHITSDITLFCYFEAHV